MRAELIAPAERRHGGPSPQRQPRARLRAWPLSRLAHCGAGLAGSLGCRLDRLQASHRADRLGQDHSGRVVRPLGPAAGRGGGSHRLHRIGEPPGTTEHRSRNREAAEHLRDFCTSSIGSAASLHVPPSWSRRLESVDRIDGGCSRSARWPTCTSTSQGPGDGRSPTSPSPGGPFRRSCCAPCGLSASTSARRQPGLTGSLANLDHGELLADALLCRSHSGQPTTSPAMPRAPQAGMSRR